MSCETGPVSRASRTSVFSSKFSTLRRLISLLDCRGIIPDASTGMIENEMKLLALCSVRRLFAVCLAITGMCLLMFMLLCDMIFSADCMTNFTIHSYGGFNRSCLLSCRFKFLPKEFLGNCRCYCIRDCKEIRSTSVPSYIYVQKSKFYDNSIAIGQSLADAFQNDVSCSPFSMHIL